jgi:O-antigen ligase
MTARWGTQQVLAAATAAALTLAVVVVMSTTRDGAIESRSLAFACFLVVFVPCLAYLAWRTDPAWLLTAGILLSTFSGNWDGFGLPSLFAPDRLVLAAGLIALALRLPRARVRFRAGLRPLHWVMAITVAYAIASAIAAGTIADRDAIFRLVDQFGLVPFAVFLLAPLALRTERARNVFLAGVVAWGGYLGATAFFEAVGPKALVFPRYILDPDFGTHAGRARGPFAEAVANGLVLYTCAVAAVVALVSWRGRWPRAGAGAVALLCAGGVLFTLTRSVWIGAVAGSVVVLLFTWELRRFAVPVLVAGGVLVLGAFVVVPGLGEQAEERASNNRTVWDRKNLNTAAVNMIAARPLVGFGWERFLSDNSDYFELADDYPLTVKSDTELHNVFLANAVELGLVGGVLWLLTFALAIGGAIATRGPPELRPWRIGLVAMAVCWLVVGNFVYPLAFATLLLWAWAGVVWAGRQHGGVPA